MIVFDVDSNSRVITRHYANPEDYGDMANDDEPTKI
jgi:hypothetical protein